MKLAKIEQAERHFEELKTEVSSFLASNPYKVKSKLDARTKKRIYFVSSAKEVPRNISLITGDILQNLRSSLDHVTYSLYLINGSDRNLGRHIYFPISKDSRQYEIDKARKTRGISDEAKIIIDEMLPYKGGNDVFWQINELNNIDKHRLLITVGSSFRSMGLGEHMIEGMKNAFPDLKLPKIELFLKPTDNLFPLMEGDELFIDESNAKELPNMQFRFDILLNEPGIIEGASIIEVVTSMIETTKNTVLSFESLIPS